MTDTLTLNPGDDDQKLLAQIVGYYHTTLKATPEALDYLKGRGIAQERPV